MTLRSGVVNDHISYFDNGLLGTPGMGSTYVVRGDEIAIVETGTSLCAPTVLAGLEHLGVRPVDVRHIVVTHVHMDHAGGAGTLIAHMPEAQVYLHSLTIPHLVDPSRLLQSATRALGELFPLHGTVEPLPANRLLPAEALHLDLGGGVVLEGVTTPGHSPDHVSYLDTASGALFTGDAVGIVIPDYQYLGPVTPPPAVDVPAQHATFAKLLAMPISRLLFSHYGPSDVDPHPVIERLRERYEQFDRLVQEQLDADQIDEAAIIRAMLDADTTDRGAWVLAGWIKMSILGMTRWHTKQREARG